MNLLEKLHKTIDESGWDVRDDDKINQAFQELNGQLEVAGETDLLRKSEAERQVFMFTKTPEKKLSYKVAGTKKLEDGTEVPFEFPDIKEWNENDFVHIRSRWEECKNLFARTEYGLLLFYADRLKHNEEVLSLLQDVFALAKEYYQKALPAEEKNSYFIFFRLTLAHAIHLAANRKSYPQVDNLFKEIIQFTFEVHQSWDETNRMGLRTSIDLTDFAIEHYNDFKEIVPIEKFLDKNWLTARYLSGTYVWGAIYVADISMKLCKKMGQSTKDWQRFKAEQYEKLAAETEGTPRQLSAISFVESALRMYKELKDQKKVSELEKKYSEIRGTAEFGEIRDQLPEDVTKRITDVIKNEIQTKSPEALIFNFVLCPMFHPIEFIQRQADESKTMDLFMYHLGGNIVDKFGNTIARYPGQSDEWNFLETYGFYFQLSVQQLLFFFFESLRADKLNADTAITFLQKSWMNQPIPRNYTREETQVVPLNLLTPSIKSFFREVMQRIKDPGYVPDLITVTDSIVLKVEAMLRYFCERLGIPTFKPKPEGIVMERNLDDILAALEHKPKDRPEQETNFDENDRQFIKYILTEKAGLNLRNKVAHGLLDAEEYSVEKGILAFTIIMRLSRYSFKKIDHEHDNA